jgi:hypothetical protein
MSTKTVAKLRMNPADRRKVAQHIRKQNPLGSYVDYTQNARVYFYEYKERPQLVYTLTYPLSVGNQVCLPNATKRAEVEHLFEINEK